MLLALLILLAALCGQAGGSVTLLLEQPYGGMGAINPTGHSAVYLDHVCADSPLQLRMCRPGELGVVISRYNDIDRRDWVAIPLLPYLYAVEQADEIPLSVDSLTVSRLRNRYRQEHLAEVAADTETGEAPAGNWYELVGSAFDRTIYGFQVDSTAEQDAKLVASLNDRSNVERYNGMFRNCADFARVTLNRFYPHAVRRNIIGDFGISTPKSVARALTHYAAKHPEANLQVFVIPQVKGTLPRSHRVQGVTESLLKRYVVPLTLISPVLTGVTVAAYVGHGRFAEPHNAPVLDFAATTANPELPRNLVALQTVAASGSFPTVRSGMTRAVASSFVTRDPETAGVRAPEPFFRTPAAVAVPTSGAAPMALPATVYDLPALNMPLFQ